ncbi:hypothetical protein [Streptomyces glomeratus]|uniref:hypothetical protein n=1 Tax=Streptomyces glomeratus TaxID=284452 RepID=UPI0031D1B330
MPSRGPPPKGAAAAESCGTGWLALSRAGLPELPASYGPLSEPAALPKGPTGKILRRAITLADDAAERSD